MICKNCNAQLPDGTFYCTECGTPTPRDEVINQEPTVAAQEQPVAEPVIEPVAVSQPTYQQNYYSSPAPQSPIVINEEDLPEEYKPLSPISYFGLQMLYSIPIVGLIFMIIFSISRGNIHRRNFTLAYWIPMIFIIALFIIAFVVMLLFVPTAGISSTGY